MAVSACMGNWHTDASPSEQLATEPSLITGFSAVSSIACRLAEEALRVPLDFLLPAVVEARWSLSSLFDALCCLAGLGMRGGCARRAAAWLALLSELLCLAAPLRLDGRSFLLLLLGELTVSPIALSFLPSAPLLRTMAPAVPRGCLEVRMEEREPLRLGLGCRSTAWLLSSRGGIPSRARCLNSADASAASASNLSRLQVDALPSSLLGPVTTTVSPMVDCRTCRNHAGNVMNLNLTCQTDTGISTGYGIIPLRALYVV